MRLHTQSKKLATMTALLCAIIIVAGSLAAHAQESGDSLFLAAEPTIFTFNLSAGDSVIGESLYVYGVSGDSIPFVTSTGYGNEWLEVDTMSASPLITPEFIFLNIRTAGLDPGTYADTIAILSGVSWQALLVPVILHVDAGESILQYMPDQFYTHLTQGEGYFDSLYVSEMYGGAVSFNVAVGESWLIVDAPGLSPPYTTPIALNVEFDVSTFATGVYTDSIIIMPTDPAIPYDTIPVTVIIYDDPSVVVVPDQVEISLAPGQMAQLQSFFVYEEHGDNVLFRYEKTSGSSWLYFYYAQQYEMTPDSVLYDIYTDSLAPGVYIDTVHFFSDTDGVSFPDVYVPVQLTVEAVQPSMIVEPPWASFRVEPGDTLFDSLYVYEENGLPMTFDARTYIGSWLIIPDYPTPVSMPGYIPMTIIASGLPVGEYYDTVEVHGYDDSPLPREHEWDISIRLVVDTAGYFLTATPEWFDISLPTDAIDSATVYIAENGGANIECGLSNKMPWLTLPQYVTAPVTPFYLPFTVNTDSLPIGTYYDTITVMPYAKDDTTPLYIPVNLTVTDGDTLTLLATIPQEFFFTLNADEQGYDTLHVYEVNGQSIEFWAYNYASWLYVDTMAASAFTPEDIPIVVNADGLAPGYYSDSIILDTYDATNTPLIVPVSLTVTDDSADYVVQAAPSSLQFYLDPGEVQYDSLLVYEIHDAALPFYCEWDAFWFDVLGTYQSPFYTPEALFIRASDSGLTAGVYTDTLFIIPDSIYFDTVAIPITVVIGDDVPVVIAEPDLFTFNMVAGDSAMLNHTVVYEQSGMNLPFDVTTGLGSAWLVIEPAGSPRITHDSVFFSVFTDGLANGVYRDTIIIYDPLDDTVTFADVKVPVILTVTGGQTEYTVLTDPESFSLSGFDGLIFRTMDVYEENGAVVPFDYYNQQPWVWVNYDDTILQQTELELWIHVGVDSLPAGMYYDTIFIVPTTVWFDTVKVPIELLVAGFPPGDLNHDGSINLLDILYLILYLYQNPPGAAPNPASMGDVNGDGNVDLLDILYLIEYLYGEPAGPAPVSYY